MRDALDTWRKKSDNKACIDYSLHMAVTDLGSDDGEQGLARDGRDGAARHLQLQTLHGLPQRAHDRRRHHVQAMQKAAKNNALFCIHAENGSAIDVVVAQMLAEGKTAPIYHALSRPTKAEAEARIAAIALADMAGAAVYIVHLSNEYALNEVPMQRARRTRPRRNLHAVSRALHRRPDARQELG